MKLDAGDPPALDDGGKRFAVLGDPHRIGRDRRDVAAVSYTHLTLPTIYSV